MNYTTIDLKKQAVEYAKRGFKVHPLRPNSKLPLTKWKDEATTDIGQIEEWWDKWSDANIGLVTGNGIVVLDVDVKNGHNGVDSLNEISNGVDFNTLLIATPSGGYHYYFRCNGVYKNGVAIREGLDIRGDGGYVVAPPSVIDGKRYKVLSDNQIVAAPEWLKEILRKPVKTGEIVQVSLDDRIIPQGERNNYIFKEASKLRNAGISKEIALEELLNRNETMLETPLDENEVIRTVESAYKYEAIKYEDEDFGDTGNAKFLVSSFGNDFRFVPEFGQFLIYQNGIWEVDKGDLKMMGYAERTTDLLMEEATRLWHSKEMEKYKKLHSHVMKSRHLNRLKAMIELAQGKVALKHSELDGNKFVVGLNNGVYDLKNDVFREAKREDYLTKKSPVDFHGNSECPKWNQFLLDIMEGDEEMVRYLQKVAGYCATGDTSEQCFFFLYGHGKNGKSTFVNVLKHILGDYSSQIEAEALMMRNYNNEPTPELAKLKGARLAVAMELPEDRRFNEEMIKSVTGQDDITARFMYKDTFTYKPDFKLMMYGNHKPNINGTDYGIWRRVRLLPFEAKISPDKQVKNLDRFLIEQEASGILNWMIEGYRLWVREELGIPKKVEKATKEYKREQDVVQTWIDDECDTSDREVWTKASELFRSYDDWASGNRDWQMRARRFNQKLEEKGYRKHRRADGEGFKGIAVVNKLPF